MFENINEIAKESAIEAYGEAYYEKARGVCEAIGFEDITLFVFFKGLYSGKYEIDTLQIEEEHKIILRELYQEYEDSIKGQYERLDALSSGHAGRFDGKVIYDDKMYTQNRGNRQITRTEEIMLLGEVLGFGCEFRYAEDVAMVPCFDLTNPRYTENYAGRIGEMAYDLSDKLSKEYKRLLEEAGYDVEGKLQKDLYWHAYYACEKYEFEEEYKKRGCKPLMSREEAKALLMQWMEETEEKPKFSINYNKDGSALLTVNESQLKKMLKEGFVFSLSKCRPVKVTPGFCEKNYKEIVKEGEKQYTIFVPARP